MMNSNNLIAKCAFSYTSSAALVLLMSSSLLASAILVQPNNYMLDDSPMISQHDTSGSLSPFYNDAHSGAEQQSDKDIVNIIGDSLARLRLARMLDQQQQQQQQQQQDNQEGGQLSQEMADLIQSEQQQAKQEGPGADQSAGSLSSSVASMLMNVAQAAAAAASSPQNDDAQMQSQAGDSQDSPAGAPAHTAGAQSARGPIMELDTSLASGQSAASMPSKSDLKQSGPIQWYNPKETIPVLKISSMATPSKYKKVYFRSEKKLVDGAFHSPSGAEQSDKKSSLVKPFASSSMAGVQRRSSRGSSASSAPPSVLQDGVIDFLKKFRDVYVQTRPAGGSGQGSSPINFSSIMSAAASSPLAAVLAPGSAGSRPNFASALSAAGQMVNSAAMLSQAASSSGGSFGTGTSSSGSGAAAAAAAGAAGVTATGANGGKSPLSPQSYVSFWSKTFPTWVRKMLKQMRRRSLYNSNKRHQNHHQHASGQAISQKASGANVVDSPGANNSGSSSSMTSGSNSNSNSSSA